MKVLLRIVSIMSLGFLLIPAGDLRSQNTNSDYSGTPAFLAATVTPNILLLLDNSGSMAWRVYCPNDPDCPTFDNTQTYSGLFDPLSCYDYVPANSRFEFGIKKPLNKVFNKCNTAGSDRWDGNLLNWITYRRMDSVKKALTGGLCAAVRTADGNCPGIGSPAKVTLKGEDSDLTAAGGDLSTSYPSTWCTPDCVDTGLSKTDADGRVPLNVQGGDPTTKLYFHLRGSAALKGSFCVDDDRDAPYVGADVCDVTGDVPYPDPLSLLPPFPILPLVLTPDVDVFNMQPVDRKFVVQVAVAANQVGVIQKVGGKARLGLMEFRSVADGDGGKVVVPIGGRQVVLVDSTSATTYSSNTAAMITGVESTPPSTFTPLAETLYTAIRYVAQLKQPYDTARYMYPLAFAPGVPFNSTGQGSIRGLGGDSEITYLSAAETALCTAPYIPSACSRDPFFFASNKDGVLPTSVQGPWLLPPSLVQCCKTFIVVFTDGEPTADTNIPLSLRTFAKPLSTTASALDDVAYWGHTTDLRPESPTDPACKTTPKGIPTISYWVWTIFEMGHPICGMQNVTIYTFFAFGNGSDILKQAARFGGYIEQDSPANGPDKQSEWARLGRTDLLGNIIPDNYYEASNADDLQDQLLAVFTAIGSKVASGSAAGMMTTSSTGEGAQYQAYFFPTVGNGLNEVKWVGYLQSLWSDSFGNLREDHSAPSCVGPPDGKLILAHDCIIKIRYDASVNLVKVDRYVSNGNTVSSIQTMTSMNDVQPMWEAGRSLALMGDPGNDCPANSGGINCRRILTWIDVNNGGSVGPSIREFNEFTAQGSVGGSSRLEDLCPYLDGGKVLDCNSTDSSDKTAALAEAKKIIDFVRGRQIPGYRDRMVPVVDNAGTTQTLVWKLGDIINSSPTVVGAPAERYDVLYGDADYSTFFQLYKDRRQMTYVGGNDGMLHAFNSGYFYLGDDPATGTTAVPITEQALFTTNPVKLNATRTALIACGSLPCDAVGGATTYTPRTPAPARGVEMWGFIPQDLLPQLKWLTSPSYDHVYFVDSKPRVTDVRIFCDSTYPTNCVNGQAAAHPGGWGTILIGGFRYGGSCSNCTIKGKPRTVTADFNSNGTIDDTGNGAAGQNSDTRVFLSSYFVLDITNPEKDPVLLWVFRDKDLGFTTATPGILRLNPLSDKRTLATSEKWYVVFGTGPTHQDGSSAQTGKMFVVDLVRGPQYNQVNDTTAGACSSTSPCITADIGLSDKSVRMFSTGQAGASMGDVITTDIDLDFKHDAVYVGTSYCNAAITSPCSATSPTWKGAMYRLTTNHGDPDPDQWGDLGAHAPTILVTNLTTAPGLSPCQALVCPMGPVTAAAEISSDEQHNIWVFFGSGRYVTNSDKTNADQQYFVGVVDCIMSGQCDDQTVKRQNLVDVSLVVVCDTRLIGCGNLTHNVSTDNGASYNTGFDSGSVNLVGSINKMDSGVRTTDGWFTSLPNLRERDLNSPVIFRGTLFFDTFIPTQGVCEASGTGLLYGLYYLTGTAYKDSSLGNSIYKGVPIISKSISLGEGLPSQVAIHVGAKDSLNGTADGKAPNGSCKSGTSVVVKMSTGAPSENCVTGGSAGKLYSEMLAWRDL